LHLCCLPTVDADSRCPFARDAVQVYHFGAVYPWGANNVPEAAKFYEKVRGRHLCEWNACTSPASCAPSKTSGARHPAERLCDTPLQITGTYNGAGGDQSNVPDFYDTFCRKRGKPMVIGEVSLHHAACGWCRAESVRLMLARPLVGAAAETPSTHTAVLMPHRMARVSCVADCRAVQSMRQGRPRLRSWRPQA
jgi:hypothetical protein